MAYEFLRMPRPGCELRETNACHEGLDFLLGRIFEPGIECRRSLGTCDHVLCTKIGAILTYLVRHFAAEEALMGMEGYATEAEHREDHARLIEELQAMQAARVCGERDGALVRQAISRWAARHRDACDEPLDRWAASHRRFKASMHG